MERDDLGHLHWAITQGQPIDQLKKHGKAEVKSSTLTQYLPRRYAEISLELLHESHDAVRTAKQLFDAAVQPSGMKLSVLLNECYQHVESVSKSLVDNFETDQLAELEDFANEKKGGWPTWASGVKQALPPCRRRLCEIHRAIFHSLREIAERTSSGIVVVHNQCSGPTVNLGQRTASEPMARS
jgi:hypothetical protein